MSYAADVKAELSRDLPKKKCCLIAEAYGVLLFCGAFSAEQIRIVTKSETFARQIPKLFQKSMGLRFEKLPEKGGSGKFVFSTENREVILRVMDVCGYRLESSISMHLNFGLLEEECCRNAFLRGAFLAGGAVTDPERGYHLELSTSHFSVSREVIALLDECGFQAKTTTRKGNYITYFKRSEEIADFLTAIGAPVAAMEVMNAKLGKTLMNKVNRRSNCDIANLDKVVAASQGQMTAIRTLEEDGRLDTLPVKLKEAAILRRDNPELSLSQLAELCNPPVSKSTLNHRLQQIMKLANS